MNREEKIYIHFTMPVEPQTLFDFIIKPSNMPLYEGFLLIPGIKNVISSDVVRKVGTIDKITNSDGSSHQSRTDILESGARYSLSLSHIEMTGFKKKLANPMVALREDWIMKPEGQHTKIERSLFLIYKKGFFNTLFVRFFIFPQMYFSLLKHHQNLLKSLSHD